MIQGHTWQEVALVVAGLLGGLVLLGLAVRETLFMLSLWRASAESHGRRNGLWRALFVLDVTIVAACTWLLMVFVARQIFGPQGWVPPIQIVVTGLLLLGPTIVGVQLRRLRDD